MFTGSLSTVCIFLSSEGRKCDFFVRHNDEAPRTNNDGVAFSPSPACSIATRTTRKSDSPSTNPSSRSQSRPSHNSSCRSRPGASSPRECRRCPSVSSDSARPNVVEIAHDTLWSARVGVFALGIVVGQRFVYKLPRSDDAPRSDQKIAHFRTHDLSSLEVHT